MGDLLIFGCLKEIFILIFQFNVRLNTTTKVTFMEFVPRFQGQYGKFPALILSHNQVNIYKKNPKLCEILGERSTATKQPTSEESGTPCMMGDAVILPH